MFSDIPQGLHKWSKEFSKSEYFDDLIEQEKGESEFVIRTFSDYMYSYHKLYLRNGTRSSLKSVAYIHYQEKSPLRNLTLGQLLRFFLHSLDLLKRRDY